MNPRPLDPQSTAGVSEGLKDKPLANGADGACTNACTGEGKNGPNPAGRLEVIADLLADLPAEQRAEVIAELGPTERAAIAGLLIGRGPEGKR